MAAVNFATDPESTRAAMVRYPLASEALCGKSCRAVIWTVVPVGIAANRFIITG